MRVRVCDQVTNEEWARYDPSFRYDPSRAKKPVVNISYDEAVAYAKWLSAHTGRRFRLITVAERKAAEKTFVADYTQHPLPDIPDVGTFGRNAEGVTGLMGTTYDWCLHEPELRDFREFWEQQERAQLRHAAAEGLPRDLSLGDLRRLRDEAEAKINALEAVAKAHGVKL
jgi:formylglycine-generating enzyme required for sulfatase activity